MSWCPSYWPGLLMWSASSCARLVYTRLFVTHVSASDARSRNTFGIDASAGAAGTLVAMITRIMTGTAAGVGVAAPYDRSRIRRMIGMGANARDVDLIAMNGKPSAIHIRTPRSLTDEGEATLTTTTRSAVAAVWSSTIVTTWIQGTEAAGIQETREGKRGYIVTGSR